MMGSTDTALPAAVAAEVGGDEALADLAAGAAAPAATHTGTVASRGWPPPSNAVAALSTAVTAASPYTVAAASPEATVGALAHTQAAATAEIAAELAAAGAAACPAGCTRAAAAAHTPCRPDGERRVSASGPVCRGSDSVSASFPRITTSALPAKCTTDSGVGWRDLSSGISVSSSSTAAASGDTLPAFSLFTLPRCSAVRALLALRRYQEQPQQQEQQPSQDAQQQQQQPLLQHQFRNVQAAQEREQQLQAAEQQAVEQREREQYSSSSEGRSSSCRLERLVVGGREKTSVEAEDPQTRQRERDEWDSEDRDDPILTDFASLEEEAFPYPLPCCSFFELLSSNDEQPPAGCLQGLSFRQMPQHLQQQQHGRQQEQQPEDRQQEQPEKARPPVDSGVVLQLQAGEERHRISMSQAQILGLWPPQQQAQHPLQEDRQQVAGGTEKTVAELQRKRRLYFTPAYTTETDVYAQLLERHFKKERTASTQTPEGEEDRLPAAVGREYLNFQPPSAFEPTELRPQTFRERVAAIKRDIDSLCIPPPPDPCPLRVSKFISHAQRLTAALGAARPRPVPGSSARFFDEGATACTGLDSIFSGSAVAAATADARISDAAVGNTDSSAALVQESAGCSSVYAAEESHSCLPGLSTVLEGNRPSPAAASVVAAASHGVVGGAVGVADRAENGPSAAVNSGAAARVAATAESLATSSAGSRRSRTRSTTAEENATAADGVTSCNEEGQGKEGEKSCDKQCHLTTTDRREGSFFAAALRAVADYFGFFASSGLRTPLMEEAVACCVAEELRGWPDFVDATTMRILKDVLAHSKARRFNRFPCRLAWPPIPLLCTYSESNLKYTMRELVNLNTYNLVQDYYRTRFHRQTSIHNFAVDQHEIEQRKLAAAEARCHQQRKARRMDEMLRHQKHLATTPTTSHTRESERLLQKKQDRETQGEGETHRQQPANHVLQSSRLPCADSKCGHPAMQCQQQQQDEGHDRHEEQGCAAYEGSATEDVMEYSDVKLSFSAPSLIFDRYTSIRTAPQNELDFFRSVAHNEAIISVAFYHATRGTKLAAFDVLSSQTLLDVRTAFLGCCEAESEPGIPVFPGSCFLIDGILYPDTTHASSGPEYAEAIAEHLSGSGKLAKKKRIISFGGGAAASEGCTGSAAFACKATGGEVRIVRPRRRLDGSIRVARPALPQRSTVPSALHEKQQQEHRCTSIPSGGNSGSARESGRNCDASQDVTWYSEVGVIDKNKAWGILNTGGAWDEQNSVASSSTCAALGGAFGEEVEEGEEENDWISIPQHKAVLNDMQLPLRSLECFVHQGTCEHRVIFWNVRQFDPKRDCRYVAAYPVRTYKPSSKAMTCQACEEHLVCKGVLNSILCSVHNPTYLCESCYSVLFGGVARGKLRNSVYAQDRCSGGIAPQIALSQQGDGARDVAADTKTDGGPDEEEENDDPDPFALHFDVYDG